MNGVGGTTVTDISTSTTYAVFVTQGGVTIDYSFVSARLITLTLNNGFPLIKQ
jgi:hypothetical protein